MSDCVIHGAKVQESIDFSARCTCDEDEIDEWKDASGLMAGGDPGGVTPELLREHQGMASDVIGAAESFVYAKCHDNDAAFVELKAKLDAYLKRWPEQ